MGLQFETLYTFSYPQKLIRSVIFFKRISLTNSILINLMSMIYSYFEKIVKVIFKPDRSHCIFLGGENNFCHHE